MYLLHPGAMFIHRNIFWLSKFVRSGKRVLTNTNIKCMAQINSMQKVRFHKTWHVLSMYNMVQQLRCKKVKLSLVLQKSTIYELCDSFRISLAEGLVLSSALSNKCHHVRLLDGLNQILLSSHLREANCAHLH